MSQGNGPRVRRTSFGPGTEGLRVGQLVRELGEGAHCDGSPDAIVTGVQQDSRRVVPRDLFVARRQVVLDFKTFSRVMKGERYSEMPAAEWNAWLDAADWSAYADADELASYRAADDSPREPKAPVPGGGAQTLPLVKEFNVFVLGIWFNLIALRFIIRALLALSGAVSVDPDAAHASGDDDDNDRSQDALEAATAEGGAA